MKSQRVPRWTDVATAWHLLPNNCRTVHSAILLDVKRLTTSARLADLRTMGARIEFRP